MAREIFNNGMPEPIDNNDPELRPLNLRSEAKGDGSIRDVPLPSEEELTRNKAADRLLGLQQDSAATKAAREALQDAYTTADNIDEAFRGQMTSRAQQEPTPLTPKVTVPSSPATPQGNKWYSIFMPRRRQQAS